MNRASVLTVFAFAACPRVAFAAPHARQRVVLADEDRELRDAVERALAPWHLTVIIEGPPPVDAAAAQQRADHDTARFVVWRAGDQLVVYDRERDVSERRTSRAGPLDPPTAAAAALTIKTMMRLPSPPDPAAPTIDDAPVAAAAPIAADPAWLRGAVSLVARIAHGDTTQISPRVALALAVRPWRETPWWLGLAGDLGTAVTVERAGFTGHWSEQAVYTLVGRAIDLGSWELEPAVALGLRHSNLDGTDRNTARSESATLVEAEASAWARWRAASWTFGARLAAGVTLGAPTYIKTGAAAEIFQVPDLAFEVGAVVAKDL